MKFSLVLGLLAVSVALAPAAPVFEDTFDYATGTYGNGVNLGPWQVTSGTVDVVGPGWFSELCRTPGNSCVDMDGSSLLGGTLTRTVALAPGYYSVSFWLGGSLRDNGTNSVHVSFAGWNADYNLVANAPLAQYVSPLIHIQQQNNVALTFSDSSLVADNQGLILDNVVLSSVPEPSSIALAVSGVGLLLLATLRRKK